MARSGIRRGVAPQFVNVPVRVDPSMPKNAIRFESPSGQLVGEITNIKEPDDTVVITPENEVAIGSARPEVEARAIS